ncbi:MAG: DUF3575 domain-containing protein [Bacteroidota bacterium]
MKKLALLSTTLFLGFCLPISAQVEYKPKQQDKTYEQKREETPPAKKIRTEPPKDNIIKINLLSPIYSTLMLFYQRNMSEENSFQVGVGYMSFDGFGTSSSNYYNSNYTSNPHTESFYFTPEYRYTFSGSFMDGSFIAPFLKYSNMTYSADYTINNSNTYPYTSFTDRYTFNYQTLGIGICLGQQYIYKNKVSLEIYAGPVYNMLIAEKIPTGSPNYAKHNFPSNNIEIDKNISNINVKSYGIRAGFTVGFLF